MIKISKELIYVENLSDFSNFFLSGDIGGTNSNFGVFSLDDENNNLLLLSVHYKSQSIDNFSEVVKHLCDYLKDKYSIIINYACFGCAGIVYDNRSVSYPTNLNLTIDTKEICKVTNIKEIFLINDFEAVALGTELLKTEDLVCINKGEFHSGLNKAYLGAGTGLGKASMVFDIQSNRYLPIASEGGHADAAINSETELKLLEYIRTLNGNCPVSWEDILSGNGIGKIYKFLGTLKEYPDTEFTKIIAKNDFEPDKISQYAKEDPQSHETFKWYVKFYARCAKNYALEALSLNGFYVAGGIASKNLDLFKDPSFMKEFTKCGKQEKVLRKIPIYIIKNYNVSLYGSLNAYKLYKKGYL